MGWLVGHVAQARREDRPARAWALEAAGNGSQPITWPCHGGGNQNQIWRYVPPITP